MRFIAIADTHLGFEIGKTSRARQFTYESMFERFEEIHRIAKKENVEAILHGGDLFNRSNPRKKVISRAFEIIEQILADDIGFIIVPGNHERAKLPNSLLGYYKNSYFFWELARKDFQDYSIIGSPYSNDTPLLFINTLNAFTHKNDKPTILLCHQLFVGATFGPHQFVFQEYHKAINYQQLSNKFKLIISGHIHRAQQLKDGLVVYPGSLERTSFIESIEPKGYLLIDLEKDSHQVTFNELETIPMFVYEYDIKNNGFNFDSLEKIVQKGLVRTLLRFTGRALSTNDLELLNDLFPKEEYPLLTYCPQFLNQVCKPLYTRKIPFNFEPIIKKY